MVEALKTKLFNKICMAVGYIQVSGGTFLLHFYSFDKSKVAILLEVACSHSGAVEYGNDTNKPKRKLFRTNQDENKIAYSFC